MASSCSHDHSACQCSKYFQSWRVCLLLKIDYANLQRHVCLHSSSFRNNLHLQRFLNLHRTVDSVPGTSQRMIHCPQRKLDQTPFSSKGRLEFDLVCCPAHNLASVRLASPEGWHSAVNLCPLPLASPGAPAETWRENHRLPSTADLRLVCPS